MTIDFKTFNNDYLIPKDGYYLVRGASHTEGIRYYHVYCIKVWDDRKQKFVTKVSWEDVKEKPVITHITILPVK